MILRIPASPPAAKLPTEFGMRAQAAALVDALLARGVEHEQATRLAVAMLEACAARRHGLPERRPS